MVLPGYCCGTATPGATVAEQVGNGSLGITVTFGDRGAASRDRAMTTGGRWARLSAATGARAVPGSQHPRTQPVGPSVLPTCLGASIVLRARDGSRSATIERIGAMVAVTRYARGGLEGRNVLAACGVLRQFCAVQQTILRLLRFAPGSMNMIAPRPSGSLCLAALILHMATALASQPAPRLAFDTMPAARFEFKGPVGDRIKANVENWLLRAPEANPGMLEMFRLRDREPVPQLVPWAGEFVGKYLISAVQALRMSDDPRLRRQVADVVKEFIATQAEDGYLGPFPKKERLLRNWDLWGHYHAIYALLLWHEQTGDPTALSAARRAADLVCATYLDTGRRVIEAGDSEMNMTILTAMAMLHRRTGEARYLRMAREVEADWERAGDYLRAGLDGREYYQSPRPRWESLHDLQGLVELWRITGDQEYYDSFTHHWRSIRRWDQRNTGAFSSGEQATGDPYAPTAIETCCTVAWMALTLDYLRLTGDIRAADDLELTTLNGGLGAQHPSGRWWTYNTPMDGTREASAHTIVFQARAGTPELNCCSVNGPRVLGMLSEWAIMSTADGLVLNWIGAGRFSTRLADGTPLVVTSSGDAWRDGTTELRLQTEAAGPFLVRLRIPAWASEPSVSLNGNPVSAVPSGSYLDLKRAWKADDRLVLNFHPPLRYVAGANETAGKVSLYRGPLLLAFDQSWNGFDESAIPVVDLKALTNSRLVSLPAADTELKRLVQPWVLVKVPTVDGRPLNLVDFASAGAAGTHYRSWLTGEPLPTTPVFARIPPDGARAPPADVHFKWKVPGWKPEAGLPPRGSNERDLLATLLGHQLFHSRLGAEHPESGRSGIKAASVLASGELEFQR